MPGLTTKNNPVTSKRGSRRVILVNGQENELGGIRCAVAPEGVTCTFAAGAEAGKGFRINSSEVVQLG